MTFILFLAALAAAVALLAVERRARELYGFATGAFGLATVLLLFLGDIERPFVLALTIATAITAVSRIKHYHSGLKLTAADCPLIFAGTFRFLVVQYPAAATVVAVAGTALAAAAIMIVAHPGGDPLPLRVRAFAAFGGVMAMGLAARRSSYRTTIAEKRGFFSTFVMSLADVPAWWRRKRKLTVIDVASEALPLQQAVPARSSSRPHIVVIQHESLFDPRLYGLPVQPHIEAFFTSGMSGPLSVDIYGGGSWQSEFSFLTGLSSTSFGPDAYFIQQRAVGRIHHTLPRSLECQGYRMALISSCRREFLNYDAFYDCMGFTDRIFSDSIPPPFDVEAFEKSNSDRVFLKAAMCALENLVATSAGPCFTYILTNFNHGPHNRRLASDHCADAREFANAACADAQYIEYYARLCETVATWQLMRPHLHRILSGRPALVLHYGDHQPVMTRRIERTLCLPPDPARHLKTFYAAEALNFEIDAERIPLGAPLDLTFLGTALLQWSGLPLDPIWATRAHLLGLQSVTPDAALAQWKRQLLRTLLDQGLIDTN